MQELKIKQKCEDAIKYCYIAIRQFPKSEKFSLASDIKHSIFKLLELIIRCNASRYKFKFFDDIDVELQVLKSLVRLANELGFMPNKKYQILSEYLVEIGKMVGGWKKSYKG